MLGLLRKLPAGVKDSLMMTGGSTAATGLSAVAGILISRMLGPVGFGEFSVGFSLMFILSKLNDMGLLAAQLKYVPTRKTNEDKAAIMNYSIKLKLMVSLIIFIVGWLTTPILIALLNFSNPAIIYVSYFLNVVTVLFEQLAAMLQSLRRVKQTVVATFLQSGTKLFTAIYLFASQANSPLAALFFYMSSPLASIVVFKRLMPKWFKLDLVKVYSREKKMVFSVAKHSLLYYLSLGIVDNLDVLMVEGFLPAYDTGLYSGASRIAMLFVMMSYSLGAVLNPRVARYTDGGNISLYLKKVSKVSVASLMSLLVLVPASSWMIKLTIGSSYLEATFALQILLVAAVFSIITALYTAIFFSLEKVDWYFSTFGILHVGILIILNFVLIPMVGLNGAAYGRLVTKLLMMIFTIVLSMYFVTRKKAVDT